MGEVMVSIRKPEDCSLLRKFSNRKFDLGANMLLFRNGAPKIKLLIEECLKIGVDDFLINDFRAVGRGRLYANLEPTQVDFMALAQTITRFRGRATFKVSSRLAEKLASRFQLMSFSGEAVGRTIAVTVDKKVKPSSLSAEAYPFEDPGEIPSIYRRIVCLR
ncbi:MAG: hypothetical protein N0A00_01585 [Candidatus Bathyarchaeota archaeon]|nr:hypothetical protein [Candidatus Bathyarchaeota archaeon]